MESEKSEAPSDQQVLIVDDGLFFSVRAESVLRKMGYTVHVASDSATALAIAENSHHRLVIVNYGSDRLSPADLTRRLKGLPDPPAVLGFVSHIWLPQVRPNAIGAGCDLLVANSALSMRLPQLVAKLAPIDGSPAVVPDETEFAEDGNG